MEKKEHNFIENLNALKKEIENLIQMKDLAKDMKFLRKIAIHIKHLHYDAKNLKNSCHAKEVEHFLSTPIGLPLTSQVPLTQAADTYSEQHPKESDLSHLLFEFAEYGKEHAKQILKSLLNPS